MRQELLQTVRSLTRRPGFALAAVLTLGLGIGANVVVFDLLNLAVWQRPPVDEPRQLVRIHTRSRADWIGPFGANAYADYLAYREGATSFSGLTAVIHEASNLDTGHETRRVRAGLVSANYFSVLGVPAAAGRALVAGDGEPGAAPAAVLSHGLWLQLFGGDPSAVGGTVRLDGEPFTVVGVAAEGFYGTFVGNRIDLFRPIEPSRAAESANRDRQRAGIVGRLRPGVGRDRARQEVRVLAARLDRDRPLPERRRDVTLAPVTLMHPLDRRNFLPTLRLLLAAVGALLLLTCANVANLLLARGAERARELGVRAALGAGRARLARTLWTESLALGLAGGGAGLLLAFWGRRLVAWCFGSELADFARELRFDFRVLGLALAVCLLSAILSSLAPIRALARADLVSALHGGEPGAARRGRRLTLREALVSVQVAFSTVLLVATGLLAGSMWHLWRADPGFDTENLLSVHPAGHRRYSRDQGRDLYRRLAERAEALPGVRSAGLALLVPPVLLDITTDFRLAEDPDAKRNARRNVVDAGFFETLGLPLLAGRLFEPSDAEGARGVVVVNRALAEDLWPGEEPLGRTLEVKQRRPWQPAEYEVVGVVGDTVQDSFEKPAQPILYFSVDQRYHPSIDLVLRTDVDPVTLVAPLREELRRLDPRLALGYARSHEETRLGYLTLERIRTQVLATLAVLGLILAVLGVGSVLGYAVARRRRELGIRMALGARAADLRRLVVGRGLALTAAGLAAGTLAALLAARLLRRFLFGVGATDPLIFAAVAGVLLGAALLATWLPARRAASLDPLVALRQE